VTRKKNKRARAAVATSIVAAASLAGVGTAAASDPVAVGGPVVCVKCDPGAPTVVLSDNVYQKWRSLTSDGVFLKLGEVFLKMDEVFIKVVFNAPVQDLFAKVPFPPAPKGHEFVRIDG
jgi:hypothetical protein